VGRLSVLRWFQLLVALESAGVTLSHLMTAPWDCPKPLVRLLVREPIKERHYRRISIPQIVTLIDCLAETNEMPFLLATMEERTAEPTEGMPSNWDLFDEIDLFCHHRPMYTHEGVKAMPAQIYFRIWKSIGKAFESAEKEAPDFDDEEWDHPPTHEELMERARGTRHVE